jgi:cation/acetate symporter
LLIFARAGLVRVARPISDFYVAARLMPAMFNGMAIAVSLVPALVFVGLAGGLGPGWRGLGALLIGGAGGLILAGLLLARYLRKFGGYTLPDFLAERFGGDKVRPLAVLAVILCSFPALAAVLLSLGLIAARVFPVDVSAGVAAGVVMLFFCTLIGGMRSLSLSQIAQYTVLLAALLAGVVIVIWQTGTAFPGFESAALGKDLANLKLEAFAAGTPVNRFGLIFCLAAGTASLPYILMRSFTTPSVNDARTSFLAALVFAGVLCLAVPACAVLFAAMGTDGGAGMPKVSEAALAVAAVAALLAAGSGLVLATANALSYDLYYESLRPAASTERRLLVARGAVVVVAGLAAAGALVAPQATLATTAASFSLAASAFLPALVLGVWWKRASGEAALAGMIAGLAVCLYYMLAPRYIPFVFYESSSFLSNATEKQAAAYEALQQSYYMADGATRDTVLVEWKMVAQSVANWWGVNGMFASLFAVPVGFVVTIAVSLFTQAPSADVQSFVKELRQPAV